MIDDDIDVAKIRV